MFDTPAKPGQQEHGSHTGELMTVLECASQAGAASAPRSPANRWSYVNLMLPMNGNGYDWRPTGRRASMVQGKHFLECASQAGAPRAAGPLVAALPPSSTVGRPGALPGAAGA